MDEISAPCIPGYGTNRLEYESRLAIRSLMAAITFARCERC